MIGQLL